MQGIREKRKIVFSEIQLSEDTIRAIADLVFQEFKILQTYEQNDSTVLFSLDTNSNSAFESTSPEIFQNTEILNGNRIVKINMKFNSKDLAKSIEFQCVETLDKDSIENYLYVSGDNSNWVNGVVGRLNLLLKNTDSPPKYKKYLENLTLPAIILFLYVYFSLFYKSIETIKIEWLKVVLTMGIPLLSFITFPSIFKYLNDLWPTTEINLGQQRINSHSKRRTKFYWIMSVIFVPLILGLVYDLFKLALSRLP